MLDGENQQRMEGLSSKIFRLKGVTHLCWTVRTSRGWRGCLEDLQIERGKSLKLDGEKQQRAEGLSSKISRLIGVSQLCWMVRTSRGWRGCPVRSLD